MIELLMSKVMLYIVPLIVVSILLVVSTIADTILGVVVALKGKEKFSWFKFLDFTAKLIGGTVFIVLGLLFAILFSWEWAILVGAAYPLFIEYRSVEKNLVKLKLPTIKSVLNKVYNFALDAKNKKGGLDD